VDLALLGTGLKIWGEMEHYIQDSHRYHNTVFLDFSELKNIYYVAIKTELLYFLITLSNIDQY